MQATNSDTDLYVQRPSYSGVGLGQGTGAAVYFKSWIGVEYGTPPNGGGGGTGAVTNVVVSNVTMKDLDLAVYINSCLSYISTIDPDADPSQYCNVRPPCALCHGRYIDANLSDFDVDVR